MDTERSAGRRIAKRIAASLAAAACLGTLLWPAQIYAAQVQEETTVEIPAVEAFASVTISDFGGTVPIRSGEGYGVSCEGEAGLQPSVTYEEDRLLIAGKPETEEEPAEESEESGGSDLCSLLITIPAGTALDSVTAENVDTLLFTDVTIGNVRLEKTRGDICCKNVSLGQGEMLTSEGNIQFDGGTFHNLLLESESGNIYVSAAEGLTRCKVAASAEKGSVTVSGAVRGKTFRQNGNGKRYLTISARGGNVVLLY